MNAELKMVKDYLYDQMEVSKIARSISLHQFDLLTVEPVDKLSQSTFR